MTRKNSSSTSTELTGGAGFTYEDSVVAYYLAALLREEHVAGQSGIVKSVAVQQAGHGHPMDDLVVEFDDAGIRQQLSLQVKRQLRISAAASNTDFREIMTGAVATRATADFQADLDCYGFVTEHAAVEPFRALNRLIDWAKSDLSGDDFVRRFTLDGTAAAAERTLRDALLPLTEAQSADDEVKFYRQFVALKLEGLAEGGVLRTEIINRLQELLATNDDGQDLLLFDRLCRIVRDGAGTARKWSRQTLLSQLRSLVRLKVAPNYLADIDQLQSFSSAGLADVSEEIEGFRIERPDLQDSIRQRLTECRLVNISGLPGCGKSAQLKRIASEEATRGPILFLKSDRLAGTSWLTFAAALGLRHRNIGDLLAEIGATGTAILFIDGIDRVKPDQKGIITDILRAIEANEQLANWKVLASSRDQGLEAYRAWFPASFYRDTGIGDVSVKSFTEEEAERLAKEKPGLRRLLFGSPAVQEIARRPFFAAVLARSFPDDAATPQTEVDLINAWWARAGHDAPADAIPLRQRALLDYAEKGVRNLGKNIPAQALKDATFAQVVALKGDYIIRDHDGGVSYSFTHDIFFEWAFFRLLIERGDNWHLSLAEAGEPPLLGRVVGLLAQHTFVSPGRWAVGYRNLEEKPLRPQWRREWLTAPPFTPAFTQRQAEFQALLTENNFALLEKLLVWFQAQHTVPNPLILQHNNLPVEGIDHVRAADALGWPSDFQSWGRLLDWLLPLAIDLPVRLLPILLEVFNVWQNVFADTRNPRSATLLDICSNWLVDLERAEYPEKFSFKRCKWDELGEEARSAFATSLRTTILRSARAYPKSAIALFERAIACQRMRQAAYGDLIGFTSTMADVAPELVVTLAKTELIKELPQDRIDRRESEEQAHFEEVARIRAIPEKDRTRHQELTLEHAFFPIGHDGVNLGDIGIRQHHSFYQPESPQHEPFASLFAKKPEVALGLVRDLANHATEGWRQVHRINQHQMGTPIPIVVEFPWGQQEFWGDWRVYSWGMGQLAPNPLECAFLAMSYWAFKQIEAGRPTDEVIYAIVEGNECYAVLGLALMLALETEHTSAVTLPIVACQRLWRHDIARVVQAPTRNIDLFGFGFLSCLTGKKAKAKAYLESRKSWSREVRSLAMKFALSPTEKLVKQRFKEALARFPEELPYEFEEARSNAKLTASLKENAEIWAGLGDIENYRDQQTKEGQILVSYEPPMPLTPEQAEKLETNTTFLRQTADLNWAMKSLEEGAPAEGRTLADVVERLRALDDDVMFLRRHDVEDHTPQSVIAAIAACVIRFGTPCSSDHEWALNVLGRIEKMQEQSDAYPGLRDPWHPTLYLITGLAHLRHQNPSDIELARRLTRLILHPQEEVVELAFTALLRDSDPVVAWSTAQLALDLVKYYRPEFKAGDQCDHRINQNARHDSLARALKRLDRQSIEPLTAMPPAWIKSPRQYCRGLIDDEIGWVDPNPFFHAQFAAKIFRLFPIEAWCQNASFKPLIEAGLKQLVSWTAERLMPSWKDKKDARDRRTGELIEWAVCLGDLLARASPFFELEQIRTDLLAPFLTGDEEGLSILASLADMTVRRHILDAATIPTNTFDLLADCVERMARDPVFDLNSYHAGEVRGYDMPLLIQALLFVKVEKAEGVARFLNGDWSEINLIMPLVTRLMAVAGWAPYVMQHFLTLCERAGGSYPVDTFAVQANAALALVGHAKGSWAGTMLPARMAGIVQHMADDHFPLRAEQATELLKILDALIDLGDRRSAALEQAEAFRNIQMR